MKLFSYLLRKFLERVAFLELFVVLFLCFFFSFLQVPKGFDRFLGYVPEQSRDYQQYEIVFSAMVSIFIDSFMPDVQLNVQII